jgi:hypothetical protein
MTLTLSQVSPDRRFALWAATLVGASLLSSFAFACAVPLAGFAAAAALTSTRRAALALTGAIWFVNQAAGFLFLHYPTDAMTLFWGAALVVIALVACESAGLLARRFPGFAGGLAAFLAAFVVYESLVLAVTAVTGPGVEHFTAPVVSRIFFINLAAFAALLMLKTSSAAAVNRVSSKTFASRPI